MRLRVVRRRSGSKRMAGRTRAPSVEPLQAEPDGPLLGLEMPFGLHLGIFEFDHVGDAQPEALDVDDVSALQRRLVPGHRDHGISGGVPLMRPPIRHEQPSSFPDVRLGHSS